MQEQRGMGREDGIGREGKEQGGYYLHTRPVVGFRHIVQHTPMFFEHILVHFRHQSYLLLITRVEGWIGGLIGGVD